MARKKLFGTKGPLIYATMVSLVCVMAASISTFAWFQAQANVNIQTNSTSTTITVSKPDDYVFYYYNKNNLSTYGTPNGTFSNDFAAVTSSNAGSVTSMTGMYPGQRLTFAVSKGGLTASSTPISLSITKVMSNTINKQSNTKHRYIRGGTTDINIGWAMNVYCTVLGSNAANPETTLTGYSTFITAPSTDKFTCTSANESTYLAGSATNNVITLDTPIPLHSGTATHSTMFVLYTVEFSNADTTYYQEVDGSGTVLTVPSTADTRYFNSTTSGNSNCYAGLNFQLNELALS